MGKSVFQGKIATGRPLAPKNKSMNDLCWKFDKESTGMWKKLLSENQIVWQRIVRPLEWLFSN